MSSTRTYRGASIDELLPQIRAEMGPGAVITRRRDGVSGGIGGFFGKRMVEVEAHSPDLPTQELRFDGYDEGGRPPSALIDRVVAQAAPFADTLETVATRLDIAAADPSSPFELDPALADPPPVDALDSPPEWDAARQYLIELGMPEGVAAMLSREAERTMAPFDPAAEPDDLLRKAIARHVRIDHGWRTRKRTIAVIGAAGAGKTAAVAKLCHAFATRTETDVRTVSLEPASDAYRLGQLTDHLDIGLRVADTPEAAARAAQRGTGLTVVDTPPVSIGDPRGIAALAELLEAVSPDETHLAIPAASDPRATEALYRTLTASFKVQRLLISRADEVRSTAAAVGTSFTLKRPVSYITSSRRATDGLQPAEPMALAELALPR